MFPAPYNNLERKNKLNRLAIMKISNALSSWKTRLKNKIEAGESWEMISKKEPMLDEDEFNTFKTTCAFDDAKNGRSGVCK
jgi:hypothetical protein